MCCLPGVNLPGESGQLGINEDLFFSGADEVENSGVVDLRRNDGMSSKTSSGAAYSAARGDGNSNKGGREGKGRVAMKGEEDDEGDEGDEGDEEGDALADLIRSERSISDAAYRAGELKDTDIDFDGDDADDDDGDNYISDVVIMVMTVRNSVREHTVGTDTEDQLMILCR